MPTTHRISWADHEKAGINISQYKEDVFQMTGIHPTHDQIRQFIHSHTKSFFTAAYYTKNEESDHDGHHTVSKPRSSSHTISSSALKNPIHVHSGFKRELYPAFELIGPSIPEKSGQVYIEWGASGLKEWVNEYDVLREELPSRRRKKTRRYEPPEVEEGEKTTTRGENKYNDNTHFIPIRNDREVDSDDESFNMFDSDYD